MTVGTSINQTTIGGNGSTTVFSYNFILDSASELYVIYTDTSGSQTLLQPSQFTLFMNPVVTGSLHNVGGTVTYPLAGPAIANGTTLTLSRIVPLVQSASISNQGDFYPTVVEDALDQNVLQIQQVSARTGAIRGTWAGGISYNFSDIVQDGANGANTLNYYQCAVTNTSSVWATDLAAGDWSLAINIQQTSQFANAAAASAAAALVSQNAASASATASSVSATAALTSQISAASSATTATTQAANASTSASSASTSASSATSSASSASISSSSAASSATTATTQASNASTLATNAATSATNAASSATAAAASASAAAGSLVGTSVTSNTIGTGSKTFTTQSGLALAAGGFITIANTPTPANYFHGQVTSYIGTSLVVNVLDDNGSGTFTAWTITTSSPQGPTGSGSGTVNSGIANQLTYYAGTGTTVSGDINATVSSGSLTMGQAGSVQGSIVLSGSTSGTTTLAAPVAGTGTMTLQAGTDTLLGRSTTDSITHKSITASTNTLGGVTMTLGSDGTGDIYYRNSSGILTRLANGGANTVLHGSASVPSYSAVVEGDLSLTDITTANVSSTAHGLAPKSPASATQFLNGATIPAYAAVKDSDLSITDITTNNVSSSGHGFAPKSPADATQFLNGATTPAYAAVKDSDLSTSDVTTNNVSTSKHGFAPKSPNDATKYLDGTGAYSVPSGSSLTFGAVGTYVWAVQISGSSTAPGGNVAGSVLHLAKMFIGSSGGGTDSTPTLSGTWQNQGATVSVNSSANLWLRIV